MPDTGQTTCYDELGAAINCLGTGQDGEFTVNPVTYTDLGNGTVLDNYSGLVWQKTDDDQLRFWAAANTYCMNQYSPDGSTSWRLPTRRELVRLANRSMHTPSINPVFTGTNPWSYWTATPVANSTTGAWHVDFQNGYYTTATKSLFALRVRCVR